MITQRTFLTIAVPTILAAAALTGGGTTNAASRHDPGSRSHTVRITDGGLEMPDIVSGPVIDLTIRNDGTVANELAIEHVQPGTTLQQAIDAIAAGDRHPPFVLDDPGGIFVLGPGESIRYQRFLQPGIYIYFVPNPDGSVQRSPAAYHQFRVTDNHRRRLPEAARNISLSDDAITLPRVKGGTHRYAITNTGTHPHELFIVGVTDPADLDRGDELGAWLDGGQQGPPPIPVHFPGSHQTIDPGVTVVLTLTLHPATTYAFVNFQNGAQATATTR